MILKPETYHFHHLDLTRQAGFIVMIYDEDGLGLAATAPLATPAEAFNEARKIVDNESRGNEKIEAMAVFRARWLATTVVALECPTSLRQRFGRGRLVRWGTTETGLSRESWRLIR